EDSDDDMEDSDDDMEDSDDDMEDSDDDMEGSEGDDDIEGSEGDDDIEGSEGEDTLPENVGPFESGFFIVDESGEVSLDYLYDGGAYKGEVAIFSIEGMEELEPGSEEFIQEAARRSLTGSELGHVVIRDRIEGAQMTEPLGDYFNYDADSYQGEKNFAMNPGDAFGVMLVPAGTVQEAFDRPGSLGAKRPLFSLATANPEDGMQMGQVSDMTGDGTVFAMEDLRVDRGSDRDYNDVMFRVSGAKGRALHLDEAIAPEKDWRTSEAGEAFLADMEAAIAEGDDDADMPLILEPIPDSSEDDPEEGPGEEAVEESEDGEVSDIEDTDSEDTGEGETEEDTPEASVPGEQIDGDEGDNAIAGTEGDDYIRGMDGEDAIEGSEGDDNLNGNVGEDTVAGGAGDDVVHGGQNDDVIFGEDGADEVYGDLGDDTGLGGEGNDTVLGGEGVDNINGNQGTDELNGNQGDDTVYGGQGDDIVRGGKDNDMLYGDLGNDVLYGDLGNDTLTGGPGEDVLIGGEGADTFALAADSGTDAIVDFVLGEDTLGLSGGLTFDDLTITQGSASTDPTLIQVTETEAVLASLTGVQESDLTPEAFSLI
ncbi:DUF4114 domain-containing protein, partial [Phormidium sp. CCY1219]|uniref:DUF4114 domain-containing protein n=1 Tax=Phormidium sp. CCY1219 TaxID=2886104 RepID=UPI002D1F0032